MNEEEKQTRKVCAWCNWVKECEDCPHREWPSGIWHEKPKWDWKECKEWRYYLKKPYQKFIDKIRKFLRIHSWFTETKYSPVRIIRTCSICEKEQEYKSSQDYTKGKWVNID